MSDVERLVNIYWAVSQVLVFGVPGDLVEVGCHAGGTSVFLRMLLDAFDPERELHVYDSFQGMPDPGPQDAYLKRGDRAADLASLVARFERWSVALPTIHEGWFADTLPSQLPPAIAFAYFDGDFYDSIDVSLTHVWPRLSPNGLILIDDYADLNRNPKAWSKLPGVKAACDKFFALSETKPFVLVGTGDLAMCGIRKPATASSSGAHM